MANISHSQPEIDRKEHDDGLNPPAKRVFPYGFDGSAKQPLSVDSDGHLQVDILSGELTGNGVTTVYQGGDWIIKSMASAATLYAVVNTGAANANVTLNPSPNQIGSVTISHPIDSLATVTLGGNATVIVGNELRALATVNISNVINSIVTIAPRTDYIGLVSVSGNINTVSTLTTISNVVHVDDNSSTLSIDDANSSITVDGTVSINAIPAGTNQIGSVTVSNPINGLVTVSNIVNSLTTITNTVNALATVTLGAEIPAGTKQLGSVTISHPINALATITLGGNATVVVGNELRALATVNISNILNGIVTVTPRTDYLGLVSVSGNVINLAGTAQMGSVTVSNQIDIRSLLSTATLFAVVNTSAGGQASVVLDVSTATIGIIRHTPLVASSAYIGLVSVNVGGTLPALSAGTAQLGSVTVSSLGVGTATIGIIRHSPLVAGTEYIGCVSVNIGGALPALVAGTAQIGSVTVSSIGVGTATIGIVSGNINIIGSGKTWLTKNIALAATNLSGSTIFIGAASKNFHITNIALSSASVVGISILNGATYLTGNASVRMQFASQSGVVRQGSVDSPVWESLANQTNFLIVTDTASPVAGDVTWYEE